MNLALNTRFAKVNILEISKKKKVFNKFSFASRGNYNLLDII